MRRLLATLVIWCTTAIAAAAGPPQVPDSAHQSAYQRWRDVIEANPALDIPLWLRTDMGPAALRSAVQDLLSIGPNLVPFVVNELRAETDRLRLYRLILLLNRVSGINLYYDSGYENFYEAVPQFKTRFLSDWDAGQYANASEQLRKTWKDPDRADAAQAIDPRALTPVRRFGVFAVPFIAETLEKQNSPTLFAAFLIITGESDLYTDYIKDPSRSATSREQKLASVRAWAGKNLSKVDRLKGLHEKIEALAR